MPDPVPSSSSARRVYIVDDDELVRGALSSLLRSIGLEVHAFGSTEAFLAAPKPTGPSCLVLDVRLRGESGLAFQQSLAEDARPHMPIVFMTGHGDIAMTVRAMKAGAEAHRPGHIPPYDGRARRAAISCGATPWRDRPARSPGPARGFRLSHSNTELVAIVDDDPFVRVATSSLVRSFGWRARAFESAAAFLASDVLRQARCLVCDVHMPAMDGIELLGQLEREGIRMPTLFITAFASARVRERARASAALCLIEKPIEASELEVWIGRALATPPQDEGKPS